jgi:hypothetical protein
MMTRRTRFTPKLGIVCLLMLVVVAACGNKTGQVFSGSNSAPAILQPAGGSQFDPQGEQIDQGLQDLENDLNSVDMLNDFK